MTSIRWTPKLFAALGAGFQNDVTVRDGVHLRWSLDPRMGLPRLPREKGYEIAFSRTKEGSISRVDLFQPSPPYPVRSDSTVLPAGPGIVHREGEKLSFLRPLVGSEWAPYWRYRHRRMLIDILGLGQENEDRALLDYLDAVMGALEPHGPNSFRQREEVVAVDVRFAAPGGGGLGPFVQNQPGGPGVFPRFHPIAPDSPGIGRTGTEMTSRLPAHFDRFRPNVFATVQGFDDCDRLVAEDWVGRHPQTVRGPRRVFPATAGALKLTARLRAPGIRWVRILRRPGHASLTESEIRWVFCDEYASSDRIWLKVDSEVMQTDPGAYSGDFLRDDIYEPFNAAAQPLDWDGRAAALRERFLETDEIQRLLSAPDTFETARTVVKIEDLEAPTGSSDDAVPLPLLAALLAGTIDPVIARLFGLYGYVPSNPDLQDRDWRVLARPPFGNPDNLDRLDGRLREIFDPGAPFFYEPGDSIEGLQLAGLVLNASESVKPAPPDPLPEATADVHLVPAKPNRFDHLIHATLTAAPEGPETLPWRVNASYEVIRGVTGQPGVSVIENEDQGPLDEIGVLPDVLLPEFNSDTCLSTGRLTDVFALDATEDHEVVYLVRGFDVFGRPSSPVVTAPIDVPAACQPPSPPGAVSARVTRQGESLTMIIDFELGEEASTVEADWLALETLVNAAPLDAGVPPDEAEWTGTRAGRLIELGFDATLALQQTPITQSCLQVSWSGGTLQRSTATPDACAVDFPGTAEVRPLELTALAPGRKAYRMTLGLGQRAQYPPGFAAWTARVRVRGSCPKSGSIVYSPETTVRAEVLLTVPAAPVFQPPVEALPLATYPDVLGSSYFSVDLRTLLADGDQTTGTLVKVYLARLEAMTDRPQNFVTGEMVIDPPGLIALAKLSQRNFTLVSDPPEAFNGHRPHVSIEVPGQLAEVYVAAIIGADGVLATPAWQNAAFIPFRTPPQRPVPLVEWTRAEITTGQGILTGRLGLSMRFPEPIPDPARPPIVQLFRRDLSTGQGPERFVAVAEGTSTDPSAARPEYVFALTDGPLTERHRYQYAAQPLAYAPWRDQHVKVGGRVLRPVASPAADVDPFADTDPLTVVSRAGGGWIISASFAAGDVAIELVKEPATGEPTSVRARIEGGELFLPEGLDASLATGPAYQLILEDLDPSPGLFRIRLRSGQALTASREARTP